jgi:hypothetical protein
MAKPTSLGMLVNFNQALEAWKAATIGVLRGLQVPSHWLSDYRLLLTLLTCGTGCC